MASGERPTGARDPARTREAILDAAREMVLDAGQARLSIRRVAERAGVTHGTIYLYFRDKDDLLYQVAETSAHEMVARLRRLPRTLDAVERLRQTFLALVDAAIEAPDAFHFVFTLRPARASAAPSMPPLAAVLEAPLVDAFGALPGEASRDASTDARSLLLSIVGLVEAARAEIATTAELRRTAERSITLVLAGLSRWPQ